MINSHHNQNKQQEFIKTVVCFTSDLWVSGLSQIRLRAPLKAAGFRVIQGNDQNKRLINDLSTADFVVIQRDFPQFTELFFQILREVKHHRIPLIYEIDDLLFALPSDHPLLNNGCYSKNYISMIVGLCEADLVTVSTTPIANYLRPFNSNIAVLHNYLIDDYWEFIEPTLKDNNDKIVIGFIGSHTHASDVRMIQKSIIEISERFRGKVKFNFFGLKPSRELIKVLDVKWQPALANYSEFASTILRQDFDILIAPLENNLFTRAKSWIKFLEYSTLGIPGVYSKVKPYEEVVIHRENGLLASSTQEWINSMESLICSPALRKKLAINAQNSVRENFMLSDHEDLWMKAYNKVLEKPSFQEKIEGDFGLARLNTLEEIINIHSTQCDQLVNKEKLLNSLLGSKLQFIKGYLLNLLQKIKLKK